MAQRARLRARVCGGRRTCGSACKVQVAANGDTDRKTRALQLTTVLRRSSSKAEPHHHELTGAHAPPRVDVVLLCGLEVDNGRHTVRAQAEVVPQAADVPPLDGVQVVDACLDTVWQVVTGGGRPHKFAHSATSHRGHSSMQCPGAAKGTFNAWRPHPKKASRGLHVPWSTRQSAGHRRGMYSHRVQWAQFLEPNYDPFTTATLLQARSGEFMSQRERTRARSPRRTQSRPL